MKQTTPMCWQRIHWLHHNHTICNKEEEDISCYCTYTLTNWLLRDVLYKKPSSLLCFDQQLTNTAHGHSYFLNTASSMSLTLCRSPYQIMWGYNALANTVRASLELHHCNIMQQVCGLTQIILYNDNVFKKKNFSIGVFEMDKSNKMKGRP